MANPYEMFETDGELEQKGIILDYGDFRVRIAHAGGNNKKFKNLLEARLKPYDRQLAIGAMDDEVGAQLLREVYADTIILNFEVKVETEDPKTKEKTISYIPGVPVKKGPAGPFNRVNVLRISKELPKLFLDIKSQAENFGLFKAVMQEEEVKN